jgi:hypothetical protein
MRVEGYLGDVVAGLPRFSGVVRELPTSQNGYMLRGTTWNHLLERQTTMRTETFIGTTRQLAQLASRTWQLTYADDFTTDLSGYTATTYLFNAGSPSGSGSWALVPATVSPEGLPAVKAHADAFNLSILLTNGTFPQSAWDDCLFEATIHFYADNSPSNTSGSRACGNVGIVVSAQDPQDFTYAMVGALASGPVSAPNFLTNSQQLHAEISSFSGTPPSQVQGPFFDSTGFVSRVTTSAGIDYRCQLQVQGRWDGSQYLWRVLVNGADMGVTTLGRFGRPAAGGKIGFFIYGGNVNGSGGPPGSTLPIAYVSNFTFRSKSNTWFQQGSFAPATKNLSGIVSRHSHLDLLTAAATIEGYVYRDTPGVGSDRLDWGAAVGADLSADVRFEEGVNLIDVELEPNMEGLATDVELASGATSDAASIHWLNIPAARRFGILSEQANSLRTGDFTSDVQFAKALSAFRGTPGLGKTLTVLRDVGTADRWRELDFVTVHAPRMGLPNARVQVLGYEFVEGEEIMTITADQFPISMQAPQERRAWSMVGALSEGITILTPSTFSSPFDASFGQPNSTIASSGGVVLTAPGPNSANVLHNYFVLNANGGFLLEGLLSFHIEGALSCQVFFVANGLTQNFTNIGLTNFGPGDYGPYDVTQDLVNNVGTFDVQLINSAGASGFCQSQVALYFPARAF